ncbi:hypothetical protein HZH66_010330 [Vespula vulgaris]|uniref:Uncharacterized protein n=1 Tax=Vespula vulgaris TaxID=7454 RepID=A0A834N016_VESVU|nr:hypothetical protein HZH66_010330 [Vespula vulgaris]
MEMKVVGSSNGRGQADEVVPVTTAAAAAAAAAAADTAGTATSGGTANAGAGAGGCRTFDNRAFGSAFRVQRDVGTFEGGIGYIVNFRIPEGVLNVTALTQTHVVHYVDLIHFLDTFDI